MNLLAEYISNGSTMVTESSCYVNEKALLIHMLVKVIFVVSKREKDKDDPCRSRIEIRVSWQWYRLSSLIRSNYHTQEEKLKVG